MGHPACCYVLLLQMGDPARVQVYVLLVQLGYPVCDVLLLQMGDPVRVRSLYVPPWCKQSLPRPIASGWIGWHGWMRELGVGW